MANLMVAYCTKNCNQWIASDNGLICLRVEYGLETPKGCPIKRCDNEHKKASLFQQFKRLFKQFITEN